MNIRQHQLRRDSCEGGTREAAFAQTTSMFLKWNSSQGYPKCVLLVRSPIDDTRVENSFLPLARYILSCGKYLYLESDSYDQFRNALMFNVNDPSSQILKFSECSENEIDLVITLGGDGTMLRSVSLFQGKHIPVFVSFRFGTLGFMTPHVWDPSSFTTFIDKAFSGSVPVQLRERLKGQIWTCKVDHSPPQLKNFRKVLNEVSIHRGLGSRVDLDIYVNNNFVTTISGDGVLVSTPTGSTGHALSAGASLVHPSVPCIMITPICVHSLSFRPIILPSTSVIKVVPSDHSRFRPWVCFDGDEIVQLCNENGNRELIVIEAAGAQSSVPCVCSDEPVGDWLKDLQERLLWNVSKTGGPVSNLPSAPGQVPSPDDSNEVEARSRFRKASTLSVSMANIRVPANDTTAQGKGPVPDEPWTESYIDDGGAQSGNFMLVKKAYSIFEPGVASLNGHHSFAS